MALATLPHPAAAQSVWTRPTLLDDPGGVRSTLLRHGLNPEILYTGDVVSNLSGGLRRRTEYLDSIDMTLMCHLDQLIGLQNATVFLYGLANQGNNPSRDVGDAQGLDNIGAPNAVKLYEAWWQQGLFADQLSVLAGLYDVNSEFDVVESATVLLNSSFGVAPEFALSGVDGPSVFPTTSVGMRVAAALFGNLAWRTALLDGVAGDPDDPHGTHIRVNSGDGLLIVSEAALLWGQPSDNVGPPTARERRRRRRLDRGVEPLPYRLKLAVGAWLYTNRLPDLVDVDAQGAPVKRHGRPGVYVLADYAAYQESALSPAGLWLFLQLGLADANVEQFVGYTGAGAVYTGLLPGRQADQVAVGVASAYNGSSFKDSVAATGGTAANGEIALEWTYRAVVTPWFALQPDLQYIIDPGGVRGRGDALVLGLRSELTF